MCAALRTLPWPQQAGWAYPGPCPKPNRSIQGWLGALLIYIKEGSLGTGSHKIMDIAHPWVEVSPRGILAAATVALLCVPRIAVAQDVENGARIAHTWCTNCHVVDSHDKGIKSDAAPPFTSVARQSGMTTTAIQVFLSTPHTKMPDFSLTRTEIRDVSAYIMSLKK